MIQSMTTRRLLSNPRSKQLLLSGIGGVRQVGLRNLVSSGRISWMGTLSDKTDKTTTRGSTMPDNKSRSLDFLNGYSSHDRMMFSTSAKQDDNDETTIAAKPEEKSSFRYMMKRYGKIFIGTYFGIYLTTVSCLFLSVQSGHIDAMYMISLLTGTSSPSEPGGVADPTTIQEAASAMKDLVALLEGYTITRPVAPLVEQYPWTANFAIAWIATKFTEPIRFGATVVLTPPIARWLGYRAEENENRQEENEKDEQEENKER
mmetsp:Transcript_12226/g.30913  ORF Transcript_12226/g.30913 Transcript_12226/m.30913 type:complete len:260 (+) Transcript_12226:179-958(+)